MIKNLKNVIFSFFADRFNRNKNINLDMDNNSIIIDVTWDDIINGQPCSEDNSIIANAWKRNGYSVKSTNCYIQLQNGDRFYPETLSQHWRFFVGNTKNKPKCIKYIKM